MNLFLGAATLVLLVAGTYLLCCRSVLRGAFRGHVDLVLGFGILLLCLLYLDFFSLGYASLLLGHPLLNLPYIASSMALIFAGCAAVAWRANFAVGNMPSTYWSDVAERTREILEQGVLRLMLFVSLTTLSVIALFTFAVGFPRGYEAGAYHLPLGVHFFQNQTLDPWDSISFHTVPANFSVLQGFFLSFLPERMITLTNFPFLAFLVLAVYGISRNVGADPRAATIAALGALTIPIISWSVVFAGADTSGMMYFAVGAYFAFTSGSSRTKQILAGLACGLAYGSKVYHLIGIVFITIVVAWQCWKAASSQATTGRLGQATTGAIVFVCAVFGAMSFWLVRNYLAFGNPFYPIHIDPIFSLLGWTAPSDMDAQHFASVQFKWVKSPHEWFVYPWIEWHYAGHFYNANAGLGPFFASLIPVAVVLATFDYFSDRNRLGRVSQGLSDRRLLLVLGAGFVLTLWWILENRQPRYAQSALVFLLPLVGFLLTTSHGWARRCLEGVAAFSLLWMMFVVVSREGVEFGDRAIYSRHFQRHQYYEYPKSLDDLPSGSTILNLSGRAANYALNGRGGSHRVISYLQVASYLGKNPRVSWDTNLETDTEGVHFDYGKLRALNVTHAYVASGVPITLDRCVSLQEVERLETNPVSKHPYKRARVLYKIKYCDK